MNREDVIRLAREAGIRIASPMDTIDPRNIYLHELQRFAQLVAAKEREASARICENYTDNHGGKYADHEGHGYECAEAIRARWNT